MKLNELTLEAAHEGLVRKQFRCRELVAACLAAIAEKNSQLNAYITVLPENELFAQADVIDGRIARGEALHPLAGIPFSVKDAICVKGVRSTGSALILDNYIPPYTATTVQRILDKGGILLGKTNCDAFGHGASNENSSYGPVRNPHDLTRVAGGSSGGSGAAVAASMGTYSIAEDTGGSVRCPAAFCGVVGLKVSYGRNSRYGAMPMASSLDSVGPIAKTSADLAHILGVIAGQDPYDSTTVPAPVEDYRKAQEREITGMTAGVPQEYFVDTLDAGIRQTVDAALKKLEGLGVKIEEVSLPLTKYAIATYYIIVPSEDSANLSRLDGIRYGMRAQSKDLFSTYAETRERGFPDEVKRRIMIGTYTLSAGYYEAYYRKAQKVRTLIIRDFANAFEKVDFLVTPTAPNTAFPVGALASDPLAMYMQDVFVCPASVAGIPALSIPCGKDGQGLPIGLQVIGPRLREDRILQVGHQLEKVVGYGN